MHLGGGRFIRSMWATTCPHFAPHPRSPTFLYRPLARPFPSDLACFSTSPLTTPDLVELNHVGYQEVLRPHGQCPEPHHLVHCWIGLFVSHASSPSSLQDTNQLVDSSVTTKVSLAVCLTCLRSTNISRPSTLKKDSLGQIFLVSNVRQTRVLQSLLTTWDASLALVSPSSLATRLGGRRRSSLDPLS